MMKKLASRKLWLALIGFVSAILVVFGVDDITVEQICTLLGALGTLCAYIFAEGFVDAKRQNSTTSPTENSKNENLDAENCESYSQIAEIL